ncbi:helix-turn-helix transcriptional regulator [Oxalobacter formigenes]|uniref:helix-turn-helix domain-containing protein n=1 Tax=Oxalobacter formigenes TaxID=847 RepID=UPI0022AFC55B|nr:helix-turn-helix transcriptional regulator [Oxalobacter formigenes]WAW06872.1 helix-turn-helix transcriptional regulator [Oxalobacter formigenes]
MSKLRKCRKKYGSLQAVSKELHIDASHLSRIERGTQIPSPDLAERLSNFFCGEISEMEILYPERFTSVSPKPSLRKTTEPEVIR